VEDTELHKIEAKKINTGITAPVRKKAGGGN
jgi:hypothetical protein